ncbi:hypothetical protein A3765_22035, partial [Oleiphilus sp. HI0130]
MSSSMRVVHRYYQGQEQERLTQLDGAMGEILRRGSEVMCLINGQRLVQLDKKEFENPVSAAFEGFMPGHKYYFVHKQGYERVVDRSAVKLEISAKDALRYSYHLWLDQRSGLLLKSQVIGLKGQALESFQFTQLELPTETRDEEFAFDLDDEAVSHHSLPMSEKDLRWPERLAWEAEFIPPGFMQVESSTTNGNVILFSDGLANYTVFVELKGNQELPEGASIVGATVIYISPLMYNDKQYTVTIVGEIPPMTAMNIAKGVRP